ncbi:MAG: S1 RNA-binding domain-containing protein [Planctomycetota bacterium]|nr:S1 RNA-binding domain-containing protein [Planctomycetota bacterium]
MTRAAIVETIAKRFSIDADRVHNVIEMLDAGLSAPYIGRVRRSETEECSESSIRRIDRMRSEFEELDRRRGTILRMLEGSREGGAAAAGGTATPDSLAEIRDCMDRFELEDLFLPHRRPEPEVQLALDRGLNGLADRLVAAVPKSRRPDAPADAPESAKEDEPEVEESRTDEPPAPEADAAAATPEAEAAAAGPKAAAAGPEPSPGAKNPPAITADLPGMRGRFAISPQLARLCSDFVNPDKGVHTEAEALAGAMRILSDRLGRNPRLRSTLRRLMRKHGVLTARATGDESKLSRHRSLLKSKDSLRQLQGRKLLAIRQAQKDRAVNTVITLDPAVAMPKMRAALGRHTDPDFGGVLDAVAEQAFHQRLVPMIEADIRLELKERGDEEALRFLSQHLRQILLTPPAGRRPVAGLSVNAKRDWIIVVLDGDSNPVSGEIKIETQDKDDATLAEALGAALRGTDVRSIAIGHGKSSRIEAARIRECIRLLDAPGDVLLVNEAGLGNYANSEQARSELPDFTVPARMAISLGRRFQDPLAEFLKVDARHLSLGMEQGLVSKANLRRILNETLESCVAHVGADVNTAPLVFLRRLPGLDYETAKKIIERRVERPFQSREELRADGLLTEAQWTSCIAFLRVPNSSEPLDRASLHPEQYPLARRVIESAGGSVEDALGQRGATRGLRRSDFEIDEATWRDLMREISHPGRDPRPRLYFPQLLPPNTDPASLEVGDVVEGIVSNVASFGAFVDLGIPRDGLIHISEASSRYVRDARELLSIGQMVRARVLDLSGQRVALSLKNVPERERLRDRGGPSGPQRRRQQQRRPGEGEGGAESWPGSSVVRAAQSRRDGLVAGSKGEGRRGSSRGQGGGRSRTGGRGRAAARSRDDHYDSEAVRKAENQAVSFNPFASFFKENTEEKEGG